MLTTLSKSQICIISLFGTEGNFQAHFNIRQYKQIVVLIKEKTMTAQFSKLWDTLF
jgi:hypothetical protein